MILLYFKVYVFWIYMYHRINLSFDEFMYVDILTNLFSALILDLKIMTEKISSYELNNEDVFFILVQ